MYSQLQHIQQFHAIRKTMQDGIVTNIFIESLNSEFIALDKLIDLTCRIFTKLTLKMYPTQGTLSQTRHALPTLTDTRCCSRFGFVQVEGYMGHWLSVTAPISNQQPQNTNAHFVVFIQRMPARIRPSVPYDNDARAVTKLHGFIAQLKLSSSDTMSAKWSPLRAAAVGSEGMWQCYPTISSFSTDSI